MLHYCSSRAKSNSWQMFDETHSTFLPFRAASSGQMPSYIVPAADLLYPLVLHSPPLLAILPFNLTPSNSCSIILHLPRPHDCLQVQFWDRAGRDAQRRLCYRQGCYSKIAPESEVLSVSVKRGAAKWLQPSISAPSQSSEMLLHDS